MADSDIVVSALATAAGISYNALTYATDDPHEGGLLNQSLDVVEIWASQTNNRTTATKVAEGNKTNALHVALGNGETWYYWIKARNKQGYYGEWYPLSPTAGIQGITALISSTESGISGTGEWTSYSPTLSALSGSLTSYDTISAVYTVLGKTCLVHVKFEITNNGTGATGLQFDLPIDPIRQGDVGIGVRGDGDALRLVGFTSGVATVVLYDGTYPVVGASDFIGGNIFYQIQE